MPGVRYCVFALYCFQFQEKMLMNTGKYCKSTFAYIVMLKNVAFSDFNNTTKNFKNLHQLNFIAIKTFTCFSSLTTRSKTGFFQMPVVYFLL